MAPASIQAMSARGTIIEPICRSSRRNTLRTIWCSCASMTPASTPSSSCAAISSSVTERPAVSRMPIRRSTAPVHAPSSATKGRVASDSPFIGGATSRATVSGYIWPSRLGTSSPKMIVRKVMITTTSAVAEICAHCSPIGRCCCSQCDSGAAKAASPTMPLSTPIDVMPI